MSRNQAGVRKVKTGNLLSLIFLYIYVTDMCIKLYKKVSGRIFGFFRNGMDEKSKNHSAVNVFKKIRQVLRAAR